MAVDIRDPRTLIGSAIYAEDKRFIGTVEEITLPDLSLMTVESGAGIKRETPVPVMEALKATIKVSGASEVLHKTFSHQVGDVATLFIRNDTTTVRHDSIDVTMKGRAKMLKAPIPKVGEKFETELEVALDVYVYMVNGTKYVEIDAMNQIMSIDGKDLMAETRANL